MKNSPALRIAVFYCIAIAVSNFFRFNLLGFYGWMVESGIWNSLYFAPMQSSGVLLGGLLGCYLLRRVRPTRHSLFGDSAAWSLAMASVPIAFFTIFGVSNDQAANPHLLGLLLSMALLAYAVFEEVGWRGYLEDELSGMSEWPRVFVVAIAWYVWHLGFLENADPLVNAKFFGVILLGSWGIGKVIHATKSVLAAACFHSLYNVLTLSAATISLDASTKWWYVGLAVVAWIVMLKLWERSRQPTQVSVQDHDSGQAGESDFANSAATESNSPSRNASPSSLDHLQ